jgi:hypothetical protein
MNVYEEKGFSLHIEYDSHTNSKIYEENIYGHDLMLLLNSY